MTQTIVLQLAVLLLVGVLFLVLLVVGGQVLRRRQRRKPKIEPQVSINVSKTEDTTAPEKPAAIYGSIARVQIVAFSSEDSKECRQLQAPVLRRVVEAKGSTVFVTTIDILQSPDIAARYDIHSVPATVLLDASGNIHSVNRTFTNAYTLIRQVDEILALDRAPVS
jgi:thioredoxin-like negative regulator of GroEL